MTIYQRGNRDGLLGLEAQLRVLAARAAEQGQRLTKHKMDKDGRLSHPHFSQENAFLFAADLAHRLSEALPEDPGEVSTPVRPRFDPSPNGLYVVRMYDGFDNVWTNLHDRPLTEEEALALWLKETKNGTTKTKFADIDYYAIFPAGTRMLYDGREEKIE